MRVSILTLGCKVNQYESECIAEALSEKGFTVVPFEEEAEVCIINTCTVTGESDRKSCQMIRRAANRIPKPFVAVLGCMSQTQPDRAGRIPGVDYVCGTRNKLSCVDRICRFAETGEFPGTPEIRVPCADELPFEQMRSNHSERTRAYLKIEDGCANRCSYCSIRLARGGVVSRDPEDVLAEMRRLADAGYRELVFTGIEIASYGIDFRDGRQGFRLIDLLERADGQCEGIRIRLGSLEPAYLKPEVIARLSALAHLAPHFHLSLQSASDEVLRRMRRKYRTDQVRDILVRIREAVPGAQFTADLMTGFPGETEEMFSETLSFVREARFLHVHVFPYSRR
ncbi:MAG: MiaB/RimO family radical SAM methylthiotransferase, partial [Clostridia bacterium]|nr:MiaB/RimO family radical SAM methylthiotransferase [Clostridia bacterium]